MKSYRVVCITLILLCIVMTFSCAKDDSNKPIQTVIFSSDLHTPDPVNGWWFSGPAVDSMKAMGKNNNQLYRTIIVPENANKAKVTIKFVSDTMASMNLMDVVWSKKKVEIKRSVKEVRGIPQKELVFDFEETRPSGADELWLCVRPYLEQDGIVTVMGGQLQWLK